MSDVSIFQNFLSPVILFFFLGLIATFLKSDLEIPPTISKFFSLYLLLSIGFKGGRELAHSSFSAEIAMSLLLGIFLSCLVPVYCFFILKNRLSISNAGAVAATYGSVSAVTFIAAVAYLSDLSIPFGGHMVAALALMESPAIIIGVMLIQLEKRKQGKGGTVKIGKILHEALTNGSVILIIGALLVGFLADDKKASELVPFTETIFKGMLAFFLLDMGLLAGRRIQSLKESGFFLLIFAIVIPVLNATLSIFLSWLAGLSVGDSFLLCILGAGASYIAVPAAMRMAVPDANAGIYVPMSLAITFPFNILFGIPSYLWVIQYINQ